MEQAIGNGAGVSIVLRFSAALVKAIEPVSGRYNCCDSRAESAGPSPAAAFFSSFLGPFRSA